MAQQIAALLRVWRLERQLSLGGLALRSGVHKSTLSRWESGTQQPGVQELEAVLQALNVTPRQQAQALAAVDAPRAIQRLRQTPVNGPPASGDLLRAMRLRRGQTQQEVAVRIGVQQSTLARWERGEEWPSTERLHTLCFVLGAREEELAVLTRGPWLLGDNERASLEELVTEVFATIFQSGRDALKDLQFLSLAARLWRQAERETAARPWLSGLYARHVLYLIEEQRLGEAQTCTQWLHRNEAIRRDPVTEWTPIINASARMAVFAGRRPNPRRGIEILLDHQHLSMSPENRAWMMSEIAEYVALAGEKERSLVLSRKACQMAELETSPIEVWHRKRNRVQLLLQAGKPEEALALLSADEVIDYPSIPVHEALLWTEALLALGRMEDASDWLQRAYTGIETLDLSSLRPKADALSHRITPA